MGALRLLLSKGINPTYLMLGIAAALSYSDKKDEDYLQLRELNEFGISSFLKYHLGLDDKSIESKFVTKNFSKAIDYIKRECL